MKIEICDICNKRVNEINKTECIIRDWKGINRDIYGAYRHKRSWKGVICDDCLEKLRKEYS